MVNPDPQHDGDGEHMLLRLLECERRSLVRLLHDDIGQNLAAIKSFAAAIANLDDHSRTDLADLASMIQQAAESSYRSAYNLMQELRAPDTAEAEIGAALQTCLRDARLAQAGIEYRVRTDDSIAQPDRATRDFMLRNTRCLLNYCKSMDNLARIEVDLRAISGARESTFLLRLTCHGGAQQIALPDDPALDALAGRVEAVGGEWLLREDREDKRILLEMRFAPLPGACGEWS